MKIEEKQIFETDNDSATFVTNISGWVNNKNQFFGNNEQAARYSSATHRKCSCGNIIGKYRTRCSECSNKLEIEKYYQLPFKEWDNKFPIYSKALGKYFFDESEIDDYCCDEEIDVKELRFVFCKPNEYKHIDEDYWSDDICDDNDMFQLPKELKEALDNLNKVIDNLSPISYSENNKFRTEINL